MTASAATAIPAELRSLSQWVPWRFETREGKPTKVPYQPHNPTRRASSTDPGSWGTFEDALTVADRDGFDGIGFVFSKDDPYAGIDFDHCIDSNGELHPVVAEYVAKLDSYTELSPSGTGLHVIVRAGVDGRKKTDDTPWAAASRPTARHGSSP